MPLKQGDNPSAIAHNVKVEEAAGKPKSQAVAIALHTAKDEKPGLRDHYEEQSEMGVNSNHAMVNTMPSSDSEHSLTAVTALTAAQVNENNRKYWSDAQPQNPPIDEAQ